MKVFFDHVRRGDRLWRLSQTAKAVRAQANLRHLPLPKVRRIIGMYFYEELAEQDERDTDQDRA
jgi:hypothetical protein